MKFLNFNKILCISPHPDDVEYSMSATIKKYKDTTFDILCLSEGGDYDTTTSTLRKSEVIKFWDGFNVTNVNLLFSNLKLIKDMTHDAWINYIEYNILVDGHECIFVPSSNDSHFEHKFANELAHPLSRVKNLSIIEYRTPSTLDTWIPNSFVDITEYSDEKFNQLSVFKSQSDKWYFKLELLKSFHSNYQSYKKNIKYVEKFKIMELYRI